MSRVLVPLAQGCEDMEAVTIIDLLRRAEIEVVVAGLEDGLITGSRGVRFQPDMNLDQALELEYDMVALPGGLPGSDHLAADERVNALLRKMNESGRFVGAVGRSRSLGSVGNVDRVETRGRESALPSNTDTNGRRRVAARSGLALSNSAGSASSCRSERRTLGDDIQ